MKKNLLSIIVIALCVINVIFSAVIVFSVVPTSNKTNQLMTQVASIIDLELESPYGDGSNLSVEDIYIHDIETQLTVNLKSEPGDNELHYAIFNVSLSIDTTSKDYKKLSPTVATNEKIILELVSNVYSNYTSKEALSQQDEIKKDVLSKLEQYFKSDFIVNISFSQLVVQ